MQMSHRFPLAGMEPRRASSAYWLGHIPFAAELVRRLRPETLVELGTFTGTSLAAFCQAVETCGLPTRCFGIDLWQGDIHMGQFEESLYEEVSRYFESQHPSTAILMRSLFDDAVSLFQDGTIDLLHIDGTHTFEAVRNDFRGWLPKVSRRGVVLLHDTNVTRAMVGTKADEFGVRQFFDSVKDEYPHAEFSHSYGLGVLCVGTDIPLPVLELVEALKRRSVRAFFANKGNDVIFRFTGSRPPGRGRRAARVVKRLLRRLVLSGGAERN